MENKRLEVVWEVRWRLKPNFNEIFLIRWPACSKISTLFSCFLSISRFKPYLSSTSLSLAMILISFYVFLQVKTRFWKFFINKINNFCRRMSDGSALLFGQICMPTQYVGHVEFFQLHRTWFYHTIIRQTHTCPFSCLNFPWNFHFFTRFSHEILKFNSYRWKWLQMQLPWRRRMVCIVVVLHQPFLDRFCFLWSFTCCFPNLHLLITAS